jgi:hypothetical protein
MIPPQPPETSTGSERVVFGLLKSCELRPEAAALTSLNLSENEFKRWGEIDFVVVAPEGLLAIEVKGGHVSCSEGTWSFTDRLGRSIRKNTSPLAQAQAGFSSLLTKHLEPAFGRSLLSRTANGFCGVFPATTRSMAAHFTGTTDMPRELVATSEDCGSSLDFTKFLKRVYRYWRERQRFEHRPWTSAEVAAVVKSLRPSFDRVPPLSIAISKTRSEQLQLTEDQYDLLDYLEMSPRLLCEAAAGTGKTFIAVETLRRCGPDTLLVTGTQKLAESLRTTGLEAGHIVSYAELAQSAPDRGRCYETLIVDEGQQITNPQALSVLSRSLEGGLDGGKWRWFADPNHQITKTSDFDANTMEWLRSAASVRPLLRKNCRNTPQIVNAVEFATGLKIGSTLVNGAGPPVYYAISSSQDDRIREVAKVVMQWLADENVRPGHIALLSPLGTTSTAIQRLAAALGHSVAEWHPGWEVSSHYPKQLAAASIEDFRGLEAPFIVLCDLGLRGPELESELYLGLTRANFAVAVECNAEARAALALRQAKLDQPG